MKDRDKCIQSFRGGIFLLSAIAMVLSFGAPIRAETHLDTLRRNFADLRLGQFMHFGMNTFNGTGQDVPNEPVSMYAPLQINPAQWVSAAKQAGFKFMVLVAKHHDGFCIWNTATTTYNCMNSGVPAAARKDVVALYVKACHDSGIVPGLYMSVQDRSWNGAALYIVSTDPLSNSHVTSARLPASYISYALTQEKELLANYGDVPFFVDDGWAWSMGHTIVPYQSFRDTMYKYSPNTLFSEHEGLFYPWHEDVIYYENSKGVFPPVTNIYASWLSNKGGHGGYWFWVHADSGQAPASSVSTVCNNWVKRCDSVFCSTTPCIDPNNQGIMQPEYVAWLKQFGDSVPKYLKANRAELPSQPPHMEYVITAVNAAASSGTARYAIDGVSDGGFANHYTQSIWTSSGALPQYVTVDLGAVYNGIDICEYLPVQIARQDTSSHDSTGAITSYQISYSTDNSTFTPVTLNSGYNGTWARNIVMKIAQFQPVNARYMRLTATATFGNTKAEISELDFGYSNWVTTTGVKRPELAPMPTGELKPAGRTGMYLSFGKNGFYPTDLKGFASGRPVTIFSLDGKRLYQQEGIPVLPGSFATQACVARQK